MSTRLIAGPLHQGVAVGSIDLDAGQATLARHAKMDRVAGVAQQSCDGQIA
ncbi:MAG: hypothetical protein VYA59_10580 [Pseudomonadota bacterium]|nr:hypothetical protein [Pseudomonadota bacterium]